MSLIRNFEEQQESKSSCPVRVSCNALTPPQHLRWDGRGAAWCSPLRAVPWRLKPWPSTERQQKDPQTRLQPNSSSEGAAIERGHEEKAKKVKPFRWFKTRQSNVPCCTAGGFKPPAAALPCRERAQETQRLKEAGEQGYHWESKNALVDQRIQ